MGEGRGLALGAVEEPTPEVLESLWSASAMRSSEDASELADTSLLALGALSPSAPDESPVAPRLLERLAAAGHSDEAGIVQHPHHDAVERRQVHDCTSPAPVIDSPTCAIRGRQLWRGLRSHSMTTARRFGACATTCSKMA